jgi:hypothetical protein
VAARRRHVQSQLAGRIKVQVNEKIQAFLNTDRDLAVLWQMPDQIHELVDKILSGEDQNEANAAAVKGIMNYDPAARAKLKRFWIRVAAGIAGVIVLAVATPFVVDKVKNIKSDGKGSADAYVKQVRDQRAASRSFNPPLSDGFKKNYTDNVVNTRDYLATEERADYQKKWVVSLNEFCISELDMNDTVVPRLVPLERSLLRTLKDMREEINGQFAAKGIERMRAAEREGVKKMVEVLGGQKNYDRFWKFKKEFYEKHQ